MKDCNADVDVYLYLLSECVLQVCDCGCSGHRQWGGVCERDAHEWTSLHQRPFSREPVPLYPDPAHRHAPRDPALQNWVPDLQEVLTELVLTKRCLDLTGRSPGDQRTTVLLLQFLYLQINRVIFLFHALHIWGSFCSDACPLGRTCFCLRSGESSYSGGWEHGGASCWETLFSSFGSSPEAGIELRFQMTKVSSGWPRFTVS